MSLEAIFYLQSKRIVSRKHLKVKTVEEKMKVLNDFHLSLLLLDNIKYRIESAPFRRLSFRFCTKQVFKAFTAIVFLIPTMVLILFASALTLVHLLSDNAFIFESTWKLKHAENLIFSYF